MTFIISVIEYGIIIKLMTFFESIIESSVIIFCFCSSVWEHLRGRRLDLTTLTTLSMFYLLCLFTFSSLTFIFSSLSHLICPPFFNVIKYGRIWLDDL